MGNTELRILANAFLNMLCSSKVGNRPVCMMEAMQEIKARVGNDRAEVKKSYVLSCHSGL
jgi:hypothetical protein